ncbi:MAG: hypothetical protein WCO56_28210 [Verrucomicrobiota bacterium]
MRHLVRGVSWMLLAMAALLAAGCGTVEGDAHRNTAERPWNNPKSWETGLPSTINEGR